MTENDLNMILSTMAEFSTNLKVILDDNLVSVILFGSAVLGDFTPGKGDLDFVVVVQNDLSDNDCKNIFELHDRMRAGEMGELAVQLEGVYYPVRVIENPKSSRAFGCYVGTGRKGWRRIDSGCSSMADYAVIRSYGVTCYGEDVTGCFYSPSRRDLLEEIRDSLKLNIETASKLKDPDFVISMFNWGPRALCYAVTGKILSKSSAADWYASQFPDSQWTTPVADSKNLRCPLTEDEKTVVEHSMTESVKDFLIHIRDILRDSVWKNQNKDYLH